jgi:hypothetical protein
VTRYDVFKIAYSRLLESKILINIKNTDVLNLFIDSANINDKYGSQLANFSQNKKKRITKISVISNANKIVYAVEFFKGSINDIKTVEKSVEVFPKKILNNNKITLTGDKGYIMKKEAMDKLALKNIRLMTPKKKNQKIKTDAETKKHLVKRYTVDNTIE